jgi:diphosphomevalonate decarboxylase
MRRVLAKAPSNIALIKYMGKTDPIQNLPENASISMTLNRLCTYAEITVNNDPNEKEMNGLVVFESSLPHSEMPATATVPDLNEKGVSKVLRHVDTVKKFCFDIFPKYGIKLNQTGKWSMRTANTFPAASGIASSASSFAAITYAVAKASAEDAAEFETTWSEHPELRQEFSKVSRTGSGSSCRSFEGPWIMWEEDRTTHLSAKMPEMAHFVLLVSTQSKAVSSSEAHLMVKTSPLWEKRKSRVADRIEKMKAALKSGDLKTISQIAWTEAWEMHSLFHTCEKPFSYWQAGTMEVLQFLKPYVEKENPPIVTLDAGPNVHIIVPMADRNAWVQKLRNHFPNIPFLQDGEGIGAS